MLYLAVPKAACSTILSVMQWHEVDGDERLIPLDPHDNGASPLVSPLSDMALFSTAMECDQFIKFSFVRNPYTRVLSCYLEKCCGREEARRIYLPKLGHAADAQISFLRFLEVVREQKKSEMDVHWAPQTYLLSPQRVPYHAIGRVERLGPDLEAVLGKRDLPVPETSRNTRWHATRARDLRREIYGPQELRLVREIYAEDFDTFDYARDLQTGVQ